MEKEKSILQHKERRREWSNMIDLMNASKRMTNGPLTLYGTVGNTIVKICGMLGEAVAITVKQTTYICKVDPEWFFTSKRALIAHRAKHS